jgi:predicted  nucleic acid-binding Zn-ribbon protein
VPSIFKYVLVVSALFIACCSAFFSVLGLGLLFVGSATAVMIMAASLEVGKLVAASFLYRYWRAINRPLKIYLTLAVLVLIAITSLGNYGYLARAYERTHTQITLMENQIASLEKEITDTQRHIEASRGQLTRVSDAGREDLAKLQQRIGQENDSFNQALARIQERRKTAEERRDRDLQVPGQRVTEQGEVLKKAIAAEESAIAGLNDRLAVLDRAVDAYTKQGGPGFFKVDSIKKGQELREQQRKERDTIAADLNDHRARIEQLRADHAKQLEGSDKDVASVRDAFAQESARLDAEEQELRKAHAAAVAQLEQQVAALQSQGQVTSVAGGTQVEAMYQRIRARNEEIHALRNSIASADIGSYRFVARAFEAPPDDVVKWLILALVIVFDPLAVSLVVGFNIALLGERPRRRSTTTESNEVAAAAPAASVPRSRWAVVGASVFVIALIAGAVLMAGFWGFRAWQDKTRTSHATLIPADSFAVMTFRPEQLRRSAPGQSFAGWLGNPADKIVSDSLADLMQNGFDPNASVYAFAKFPSKRATESGDRPVMLCGFVARVTDSRAAEASLSRLADQFSSLLRASSNAVPSLARSRAMIHSGTGRYMDPEGGFFTFGITKQAAVLLIEFEGDPRSPCVENEIQLCLAAPKTALGIAGSESESLPPRALSRDGAVALWFDAGRFFNLLPKNTAAEARYQQLERHLGFEMVIKVQPSAGNQLNLIAEYAYRSDRFKNREQANVLQLLANLGSPEAAGFGGRLMDRCVDTLDYDSLIERLRATLGGTNGGGAQQVLVEKSYGSTTNAQFVLNARYDPQAGPPLAAAVQTLFQ